MKFLPIFGAMLLVSVVATFLFAGLLIKNIYAWSVLIALVSAILIWAFAKQSDRIEALESRIKALEEKEREE